MGYGLSLNQDGKFEEFTFNEEYRICENQGVREGLLQEEWPPYTLSFCCGYRLCAWIYPQVA